MTDKPTETGEDLSPQEDTFSSEDSTTEAWQDALPPEDDFHDQDDGQEEVLDEMIEESSQQEAGGAPKRGRGVLLGVLGVGALIIGGMAYFQFGTSSKDEGLKLLPVSNVMNIKEIRNVPSPKENLAAQKEKPLEATGKVDMTALFHQAQKKVESGGTMALPVKEGEKVPTEKPESVEKNSEILSSSDNGVAPPLPPAPALPSVTKDVQEAKAETLPVKKEEIKALEQKSETLPQVAWEARLNDMTAKMEALKGDLDRSLQQNAQLVSQMETLKKGAGSSQEATLREQVSQLEQKLALKDKKQKKGQPVSEEKGETALVQANSVSLVEEGLSSREPMASVEEVKKKEKAATSKSHAKKTAKKKAAKTKPALPSASAPSWVLRAATPDAAWVSLGKESQELRRVAVGESLQGLGKIKEIRQKGEQWEVVGEKGTLP
ncbi:MAG: hypothetical protein WC612_01380 [Bdellovibrionales bacterium]|jgi:hypothetical protein